jgi:hypothetical protein
MSISMCVWLTAPSVKSGSAVQDKPGNNGRPPIQSLWNPSASDKSSDSAVLLILVFFWCICSVQDKIN